MPKRVIVSAGDLPLSVTDADTNDQVIGEFLFSGAAANGTVVNGGGVANVYDATNGNTSSATVLGGSTLTVETGDVASNTIVSGGTEIVQSGGTAAGTTLSGGTEVVSSGGIVSGVIDFVNSGELILDQSTKFGGTISGLSNTSEKLDLADIPFGPTTSMSYSGNALSGTLSVTDGRATANIPLLGDYTTGSFTATSDGHGGTLIVDPPPHEVSVPGSNLFFANIYNFDTTTAQGQAYIKCILAAEQTFASLWTTPAYITLTFGLADLGGFQNGWIILAENAPTAVVNVSYSQLRSHLAAQENVGNNYYGQTASQHLPATNPATGNANWSLPEAYARMLGLSTAFYNTDDTITINSNPNTHVVFDQSVTNSLEHEFSECAMGRVGGLGDQGLGYQSTVWSTMDLFRYSPTGQLSELDGRNGSPNPYFSYDGGTTLSYQAFNDRLGPNPPNDPAGDTADFIDSDVFGVGNNADLSQTDVETMDVLGWTPSSNVLWARGASGNFASAFNWLQANAPSVPGPSNDVIIAPFWNAFGAAVTTPFTVTSLGNETINSLTTGPMATLGISGGTFTIANGGTNNGTLIVTSGATLSLGGFVNDAGTVQANGGTVDLTGDLTVEAGGSALKTAVLSGASQFIDSGGYASGAIVAGTQFVFAGATASATTVSSGGTNIINGGVVTGDIVNNGGFEQINAGSAIATIVNSGGTETIEGQGLSPTTLVGTTVNSGGSAFLYPYASITGSIVDNGVITVAGGQFSGTLTGSGSVIVENYPFVLTGGDAFSGSIVVSGTTLELSSASAAGSASIVLNGGNDVLRIDGAVMPRNVISGLAIGDAIDLAQVALSGGSATLTSSNVLQITEGGSIFRLQLDPQANYTTAPFTLSQDGSSGTFIAFGQSVVASSLIVSAGHTASNLLVTAGGTLTVLSGGTATSVIDIGTENVSSGGVVSNTTLQGGIQYDSGTAIGTTIVSGGTQSVIGSASNTSVVDGGRQYVGGSVSNTIVSGGGTGSRPFGGGPNGSWQVIDVGGTATATTILSNGVQNVAGVAIGTIVSAGGTEQTDQGLYFTNSHYAGYTGSAIGTLVNSGGVVNDAGLLVGATINNGGLVVVSTAPSFAGGIASSTHVSSGGSLVVSSGGTTKQTTIFSGGSETIMSSGGFGQLGDIGAVLSGGMQFDYGLASGVTVFAGSQVVESGGTASSTTIDNGGREFVSSGGTAIGIVISSGGYAEIFAGASTSGITISGGTLELAGALGPGGGAITFAGVGATLKIDGSSMPTNVLSGFVPGDTIDLTSVPFVSGGTTKLQRFLNVPNQLLIGENGSSYALQLDPAQNFSGISFLLSSDGSGGVDVTAALFVAPGNSVSGAVLTASISQLVSGTAVSTTINDGGSQLVVPGGIDINAQINDGGLQTIFSGGTASATTVNDPGTQVISAGGVVVGAVLSGGEQDVFGSASGTTVEYGGSQYVGSGGTVGRSIVNYGGTQSIDAAGSASGTTLNNRGVEFVGAGGTDLGALISGGRQDVFGAASGATVFSGGLQIVESGGTANGTTISGGMMELMSGSSDGGSVTFAGTGGTLVIDGPGANTVNAGAGNNTVDYSNLSTPGLVAIVASGIGTVNKGGANGNDSLNGVSNLVDIGTSRTNSDVFEVDATEQVTANSSNFNYLIELSANVNLAYGSNFFGITEFVSNVGTNTINFGTDANFAYLYGSTGNDTLTLGSGGGYLFGEGGTNVLTGGANATNLFVGGGGGSDTMNGGGGTASNFYFVDGTDQVNGAGTFNAIIELVPHVTLQLGSSQYQDVQEFVAYGASNSVSVANSDADFVYLYGGSGNDTLSTGSGGGYLLGEGGTNSLTGGGGLNVFVADGASGVDTMNGGSGNNVYYIDGNSTVHGAGTFNTVVELQQNVSLALNSAQLGSDVQEVVLSGGTNTADFSSATSSVYLYGTAGNDTLLGGSGNDYLFGGAGSNTFQFQQGWGYDTIMDWTSGTNDIIDLGALSGLGVHALSDIRQAIVNGSDVITSSHTGSNSITLNGFNSTLIATSFKFA
ncbi:MAG: hypothetical protein C5B56_15750 [Proteobacteria bacterium]|nr:MAG: hypothetical protein C5B56_15750 [Pseudomonadota bacterium]